ncbi:hypothetical protein BSKO_07870 [Bryopsis sp. KO-2023]|nr:hypothetical protein BSKO_07870 [Bryopsis sp. KO-2023]
MSDFPTDRIRNFSIIAHVDHGKSTLADRLMETTGAIESGSNTQYLDKLQVERERGITVKAQTVSLVYKHEGKNYLLNLIDTPGHVDFCYEVSRSLAACQGAILLVDASQGIQAQTVANFYLAFEQNLEVVPVINKIDMPSAEPERVAKEMQQAFDVDPDNCLLASAKTGVGVEEILKRVVEVVPPPKGSASAPTRLFLFDAFHDEYRGVICLVEVVDGKVSKGDKIVSASSGETYEVLEIGAMMPEPTETGQLLTGQVGYMITGMKTTRSARIGDTWHLQRHPVEPLPGFKPAKANVFAGLYPVNADDFDQLHAAMDRLTLNDSSVTVRRENSNALGSGFRCGFLGMLHMDVFRQRLEQEYGAEILLTTPTVPYIIEQEDGTIMSLENPCDFPESTKLVLVKEPIVAAMIVTPASYVGKIMELCQEKRGEMEEHSHLGSDRVMLKYKLPLSELAADFFNDLKSVSQGYASLDYEEGDYSEAPLQKLDLLINGESIDAMARIVHKERAQAIGRALCQKLRSLLDRQLFQINIQAAANNKILARETISAFRKDVTSKCYGGDVSRKRKLLEKQKEGKKKMRRMGMVNVPQEAFQDMMKIR